MTTAIVCLVAVTLDHWLGEPRRAHPLTLFHRLVERFDDWLAGTTPGKWRGAAAVALLAGVPAAVAAALTALPSVDLLAAVILLYLTLGTTGLLEQAAAAATAVETGDAVAARRAVAWLVGHDPGPLEPSQAVDGTVAAVLSGANGAVFTPLFWFVVAGLPGVLLYRLNNTLAAIWIEPSARFGRFGAPARRLDRLMDALPARLAAATYGLLGDGGGCLRGWRGAHSWSAVAVLRGAGAGALGLRLDEGDGEPGGRGASVTDIDRAGRLVRHSVWLWLGVIAAGDLFLG